jgi:hypothetical protein
MKTRFIVKRNGFTLVELMIAGLLISMVFLGGISVYMSGAKMMKNIQASSVTSLPPSIYLEDLPKKIQGAMDINYVNRSRVHIRVDQSCTGVPNNTPANAVDDRYWHYEFTGSALRALCDAAPNTSLNNSSPILIDNVDTSGSGACNGGTNESCFRIDNPTGVGADTVLYVHLRSLPPVQSVDTSMTSSSIPKR